MLTWTKVSLGGFQHLNLCLKEFLLGCTCVQTTYVTD